MIKVICDTCGRDSGEVQMYGVMRDRNGLDAYLIAYKIADEHICKVCLESPSALFPKNALEYEDPYVRMGHV
jgi:hypothetical protein